MNRRRWGLSKEQECEMGRKLASVFVAVFLSWSAMAQDVARQYDRSADFSKYRTFKWVALEGGSQVSQLIEQNIREVVNAQLAKKGLRLAEGDAPAELYVAYQATIDSQKELNWYNSGGYWGWGGGMGSATTSTIHVGTLAIDFYDAAERKMIWRGTATKTLNPSGNPDKNYKNLQKAVAKLLKEFPPGARK
jgi:hypothetical protein